MVGEKKVDILHQILLRWRCRFCQFMPSSLRDFAVDFDPRWQNRTT